MPRRQLLEETGVEVACVVDEHVDVTEAVDRRPHCRLRGREARNLELDHKQVVRRADGIGHGVGSATCGDDRVSGRERRLRDLDAHAATGARDEPNLLIAHVLQVPSLDLPLLVR